MAPLGVHGALWRSNWGPSGAQRGPQNPPFGHRLVINGSKRRSQRGLGNSVENGGENGAQNGWILRAWNLENRAPACTGCVLSKIDASRNGSGKGTKMGAKTDTKMKLKGLLGRSWGRLWRLRSIFGGGRFGMDFLIRQRLAQERPKRPQEPPKAPNKEAATLGG